MIGLDDDAPDLGDADTEQLGPEDPQEQIIDPFPDEDEVDIDDQAASDLDIGSVVETARSNDEVGGDEIVLDIGELLDDVPEHEAMGAEDAAGPRDLDPSADLEPLPEVSDSGDEIGTEEGIEGLVSGELPSLDADEDGDFVPDLGDPRLGGMLLDDEAPLEVGVEAWLLHLLSEVPAPLSALDLDERAVLLAERTLWSVSSDNLEVEHVAASAQRIAALCSLPDAANTIVFTTSAGKLLRTSRAGNDAEPRAVHVDRGPAGSEGQLVELCRIAGALLVRTSTGRVLKSTDFGQSFTPVALPGAALALGRHSERPLVLVKHSNRVQLYAGDDLRAPLQPTSPSIGIDDGPVLGLAEAGDVVALLTRDQGLYVSSDAGKSFRPVPGSRRATAMTAGKLHGAPTIWLALHSEDRDDARIVSVHPETFAMTRMAALEPELVGGTPDGSSRIVALAWDEQRGRLWLAGSGGAAYLMSPKHSSRLSS